MSDLIEMSSMKTEIPSADKESQKENGVAEPFPNFDGYTAPPHPDRPPPPVPTASPSMVIEHDATQTWRYKPLNLGFFTIPAFTSPTFQLSVATMICLLNPGLFNALAGIGAGGELDAKVYDNSQVILYSVSALFAWFSGSICNMLGIRLAMTLGALGYSLFSGSLLCHKHTGNVAFVYCSGAFLGVSAAFLWTAQGAVLMSYPTDLGRGRAISWFLAVFNIGGVIGSVVPLATNSKVKVAASVHDSTYIVFIVLMALGGSLGTVMCNAKDIRRSDGTWVDMAKEPTWREEFHELLDTFRTETYVLWLFPMFFTSNLFYPYQFNGVNQAHLDVRARALNNFVYWIGQILGAMSVGYFVDNTRFYRATKAKLIWLALVVFTMAIWGGGYAWQLFQPDRPRGSPVGLPVIDWSEKPSTTYAASVILYILYGFYDGFWQVSVYWFLGALSCSVRESANFTGFYKGIQSTGAAVLWRMDGVRYPYATELLVTWGLLVTALAFAFPVIFERISNQVYDDDNDQEGCTTTEGSTAGDTNETGHDVEAGATAGALDPADSSVGVHRTPYTHYPYRSADYAGSRDNVEMDCLTALRDTVPEALSQEIDHSLIHQRQKHHQFRIAQR